MVYNKYVKYKVCEEGNMFRIICYSKGDVEFELTEKEKCQALLLAQVMFNAGYSKVEVYDDSNMLILTI
jgi:hypothetical protein